MKRHTCLAFANLLVLLFAGCVPFPNAHYFAPAVSGTVIANGSPVSGVRVSVSSVFSAERQVAVTDTLGRFATESIRELRATASLVGDPLYGYTVELASEKGIVLGYRENSVGYAPVEIKLTCDLERPIAIGAQRYFCVMANDS